MISTATENQMDTDTLQQLLTMVGGAGEGAFTLALVYLAQGYFTGLILLATLFVIARTIYTLVMASLQANSTLENINDLLDTRYTLPLDRSEKKAIAESLSALRKG